MGPGPKRNRGFRYRITWTNIGTREPNQPVGGGETKRANLYFSVTNCTYNFTPLSIRIKFAKL